MAVVLNFIRKEKKRIKYNISNRCKVKISYFPHLCHRSIGHSFSTPLWINPPPFPLFFALLCKVVAIVKFSCP